MLVYIIIIIAGIILDQITKFWASNVLSGVTTYSIIPNVLHFTYVENTGAAFNIFSDKQLFLIIITLIFIVLLSYLFYLLPKTKHYNLANLALALMLSGAIGNLIDRILLSYVVDFIDLRIIHFAVFNVADSLVVVGACLLLYSYLKNQLVLPNKKPKLEQEDPIIKEDDPERDTGPIRKDVLKDLKPKKRRTSNHVVVKTEIVRLKSINPQTFAGSDFTYNDYSNTYNPVTFDSREEIEVKKNNRYFDQSDHYYQTIQETRENEENSSISNRFMNSIDDYEERINKEREQNREKEKNKSEWNPEISNEIKVKTYEYDWNPGESESSHSNNRYEDQIKHYEKSIESNYKSEDELSENESNTHNRYQDSTDSYIESIKKVKEKSYLEN